MPPRVIKRQLTNGRIETIGNKRTEGHGIIPATISSISNAIDNGPIVYGGWYTAIAPKLTFWGVYE